MSHLSYKYDYKMCQRSESYHQIKIEQLMNECFNEVQTYCHLKNACYQHCIPYSHNSTTVGELTEKNK
jgi:hypothetical protein